MGRHIVSLRCADSGKRLSTVELMLIQERKDIKIHVVQHHQYRDHPPAPLHEQLLLQLLQKLGQVEHQPRLEQLHRAYQLRQMQQNCAENVDQFTLGLMQQALASEWQLPELAALLTSSDQNERLPEVPQMGEPVAPVDQTGWLQRVRQRIQRAFAPSVVDATPAAPQGY